MKRPALDVMSALSDPTRAQIVQLLLDRERSVGEIAAKLPVSRPAVSKHLRILENAGVVSFHRAGTRNVYALRPQTLGTLRDHIDAMWRQALARFATVAEGQRVKKVREES